VEDILGVKNFLTRFVSKIEVGYHMTRMFYTYPIDDLLYLNENTTTLGAHEPNELLDISVERFFASTRFEQREKLAEMPIDWSNME
jgi:hypothetical protein